jgi:hypothetical protein
MSSTRKASARAALKRADRQVAEGQRRIAKQRRVLDDLRRSGLPTGLAQDTLVAVHTNQQLVVEDRESIKARIDEDAC